MLILNFGLLSDPISFHVSILKNMQAMTNVATHSVIVRLVTVWDLIKKNKCFAVTLFNRLLGPYAGIHSLEHTQFCCNGKDYTQFF